MSNEFKLRVWGAGYEPTVFLAIGPVLENVQVAQRRERWRILGWGVDIKIARHFSRWLLPENRDRRRFYPLAGREIRRSKSRTVLARASSCFLPPESNHRARFKRQEVAKSDQDLFETPARSKEGNAEVDQSKKTPRWVGCVLVYRENLNCPVQADTKNRGTWKWHQKTTERQTEAIKGIWLTPTGKDAFTFIHLCRLWPKLRVVRSVRTAKWGSWALTSLRHPTARL